MARTKAKATKASTRGVSRKVLTTAMAKSGKKKREPNRGSFKKGHNRGQASCKYTSIKHTKMQQDFKIFFELHVTIMY